MATEYLSACPGGVIGCFPACTAQVSPPERIGSRLGFVLTVMSISTLTGPPIAGGTPFSGAVMDRPSFLLSVDGPRHCLEPILLQRLLLRSSHAYWSMVCTVR